MTAPTGLVAIVLICIVLEVQRKCKDCLLYTGALFSFISILGLTLLLVIQFRPAKLVGIYLCFSYIPTALVLIISLSLNVSGYTKKIFYSSSFTFFMTFGNFIGPQLIIARQAPLYIGAMLTCIAANCVSMLALCTARNWMAKMNQLREKNNRMKDKTSKNEYADFTDRNSNFMYTL